jgi:hypothetical protein
MTVYPQTRTDDQIRRDVELELKWDPINSLLWYRTLFHLSPVSPPPKLKMANQPGENQYDNCEPSEE